MKQKRLMVMAGGTGGHVFPGLAVAKALIEQGWQVRWLGTADRMEAQLVPNANIEIDFIRISGLRGSGLVAKLMAPTRIIRAVWQAKVILKRYHPDVVLGMGGYVSGPGGVAAWLSGIPVVLHEQNGVAGMTNRWLSKIARRVLQAFPSAFKNAEVVGNPVREAILALPSPEERYRLHEGALKILVFGGSQGASILNQTLPETVAKLGDKVKVWHQVGKNAVEQVEKSYAQIGVTPFKVNEFIDDMAEAYAWADLVICRSGALTVSEISAAGVAAIFIPFLHKDRQQYWNAYPLEKAQAAVIIEQMELNADKLHELIVRFNRDELLQMANRAKEIAILNATEKVVNVVINVSQ